MANVNKFELMPEHTSGVPPVSFYYQIRNSVLCLPLLLDCPCTSDPLSEEERRKRRTHCPPSHPLLAGEILQPPPGRFICYFHGWTVHSTHHSPSFLPLLADASGQPLGVGVGVSFTPFIIDWPDQPSFIIWQVTDELEWPSPPSFILPPVSPPPPTTQSVPAQPPPPPYLGLPQHTGHGASALTNRPVDYPAHYTRTHQGTPNSLPLTTFPSGLALNTATTVSETVHLTDLTQVKSK